MKLQGHLAGESLCRSIRCPLCCSNLLQRMVHTTPFTLHSEFEILGALPTFLFLCFKQSG